MVFAMTLLLVGCTAQVSSENHATPLRILSLGDSYTIGENAAADERWPVQLAGLIEQRGLSVAEPLLIAQTGWTTDELAAAIQRADPQGLFALVTLLIGVNNQYRGRDLEEYRAQFRSLLEQAIAFAGGDPGAVIVLSIPDWGVAPFAAGRDRTQIGIEIDRFNAVNRAESEQAGVRYVDVTHLSRQAAGDPALTAPDGLHPSGKMYRLWAEQALPQAMAALEGERR